MILLFNMSSPNQKQHEQTNKTNIRTLKVRKSTYSSRLATFSQIMEGSTSNSKNVAKKSTSLGRMMGFRHYTVRPRCEPKSLQPACTKFSNFVPILDTHCHNSHLYYLCLDTLLFCKIDICHVFIQTS